jgi:hypothetical protein
MKRYLVQLATFLIFLALLQRFMAGTWEVKTIWDLGAIWGLTCLMFGIVGFGGFLNTMDWKWRWTWIVLVLGPIVVLLLAVAFVDVENSKFWSPENFD